MTSIFENHLICNFFFNRRFFTGSENEMESIQYIYNFVSFVLVLGKKKKKKRSNLNRELSDVKIVRLQLHRVKRYHFTILWPTRLVRIGFVTRDGSY